MNKADARTSATATLFALLSAHGASFPPWFWRRVLRDVLVRTVLRQRVLLDTIEQERTGERRRGAREEGVASPRDAVLSTMVSFFLSRGHFMRIQLTI